MLTKTVEATLNRPRAQGFRSLKRLCRPLKTCVFRGPSRTRLVFSKALEKLSPFYFPDSVVLHVSCSFLSLSHSPNFFGLFSPARTCTCSHPADLRRQRSPLPRFSFEALNAVLHLSEICDQLDLVLATNLIWLKDSQTGSHLGHDDPNRCK